MRITQGGPPSSSPEEPLRRRNATITETPKAVSATLAGSGLASDKRRSPTSSGRIVAKTARLAVAGWQRASGTPFY
jgi:hypothetical protein